MHYEGKDRPKPGYQILDTTPYSRSANLASGSPGHQRTFLTFRRAAEPPGHHTLGVTDICLVMPSKGESTPHTFCRVDKNLNTSMVGLGRAPFAPPGAAQPLLTPQNPDPSWQWGPALYLCYKIAVAKDNTLVYEAGGELRMGALLPLKRSQRCLLLLLFLKIYSVLINLTQLARG